MGCIHSNFNGGCTYYDELDPASSPTGCDTQGYCVVEEDPDPQCDLFEDDDPDGDEDRIE